MPTAGGVAFGIFAVGAAGFGVAQALSMNVNEFYIATEAKKVEDEKLAALLAREKAKAAAEAHANGNKNAVRAKNHHSRPENALGRMLYDATNRIVQQHLRNLKVSYERKRPLTVLDLPYLGETDSSSLALAAALLLGITAPAIEQFHNDHTIHERFAFGSTIVSKRGAAAILAMLKGLAGGREANFDLTVHLVRVLGALGEVEASRALDVANVRNKQGKTKAEVQALRLASSTWPIYLHSPLPPSDTSQRKQIVAELAMLLRPLGLYAYDGRRVGMVVVSDNNKCVKLIVSLGGAAGAGEVKWYWKEAIFFTNVDLQHNYMYFEDVEVKKVRDHITFSIPLTLLEKGSISLHRHVQTLFPSTTTVTDIAVGAALSQIAKALLKRGAGANLEGASWLHLCVLAGENELGGASSPVLAILWGLAIRDQQLLAETDRRGIAGLLVKGLLEKVPPPTPLILGSAEGNAAVLAEAVPFVRDILEIYKEKLSAVPLNARNVPPSKVVGTVSTQSIGFGSVYLAPSLPYAMSSFHSEREAAINQAAGGLAIPSWAPLTVKLGISLSSIFIGWASYKTIEGLISWPVLSFIWRVFTVVAVHYAILAIALMSSVMWFVALVPWYRKDFQFEVTVVLPAITTVSEFLSFIFGYQGFTRAAASAAVIATATVRCKSMLHVWDTRLLLANLRGALMRPAITNEDALFLMDQIASVQKNDDDVAATVDLAFEEVMEDFLDLPINDSAERLEVNSGGAALRDDLTQVLQAAIHDQLKYKEVTQLCDGHDAPNFDEAWRSRYNFSRARFAAPPQTQAIGNDEPPTIDVNYVPTHTKNNLIFPQGMVSKVKDALHAGNWFLTSRNKHYKYQRKTMVNGEWLKQTVTVSSSPSSRNAWRNQLHDLAEADRDAAVAAGLD